MERHKKSLKLGARFSILAGALLVRPAGARSNECKSRIHPAVGRI